jgi:hypothetical protein
VDPLLPDSAVADAAERFLAHRPGSRLRDLVHDLRSQGLPAAPGRVEQVLRERPDRFREETPGGRTYRCTYDYRPAGVYSDAAVETTANREQALARELREALLCWEWERIDIGHRSPPGRLAPELHPLQRAHLIESRGRLLHASRVYTADRCLYVFWLVGVNRGRWEALAGRWAAWPAERLDTWDPHDNPTDPERGTPPSDIVLTRSATNLVDALRVVRDELADAAILPADTLVNPVRASFIEWTRRQRLIRQIGAGARRSSRGGSTAVGPVLARCARCGRELTDQLSADRGYGRECWLQVLRGDPPEARHRYEQWVGARAIVDWASEVRGALMLMRETRPTG